MFVAKMRIAVVFRLRCLALVCRRCSLYYWWYTPCTRTCTRSWLVFDFWSYFWFYLVPSGANCNALLLTANCWCECWIGGLVGYVDLGSAISASFSEPLVKTGEANFYRFPVPSREVSRFFITCIHHFPEHPPYSTLVGPRGDGNCGELVLVIRSIYSLVHDHQNLRHLRHRTST